MSKILVQLNDKTSRIDWLKYRQNGIGGSDAAAVLGLSRWKSPLDVYMSKVKEISEEDAADISEAAYWGNVLEDVVAREFSKRTGLSIRRKRAVLVHDDYPFLMANIDREIVGQKVGLECKTASEYKKGEWKDDEIPAEYIIQCQHYMAVTGYAAWWIAVLIGGNKFVFKLIERDEEFIEMLMEKEIGFWNRYMLGDEVPAVDGTEQSTSALAALYPQAEKGKEMSLDDELEKLLVDRRSYQNKIDSFEDKIREIDNKIKEAMGDNEIANGTLFKISWSNSSRTTVDSKKLKAELPEIYEKYSKTSNSRTFRVKEID